MENKKFDVGQHVIYPSHGMGQIVAFENHEVGGHSIQLIVISFDKDKMLMRIPLEKAKASGLRSLSSPDEITKAFDTLKSKIRPKKVIWSRRAQEYEAKINSGNLVFLAEVIRDLYKCDSKSDQSYSERQIYQSALDRFVRELAAIESIDQDLAMRKIEDFLKAA